MLFYDCNNISFRRVRMNPSLLGIWITRGYSLASSHRPYQPIPIVAISFRLKDLAVSLRATANF